MDSAIFLFLFGAASFIGYLILRFFWELIPVGGLAQKAVFITGCDSGFGRALSLKCARAGITVFAGCLTDEGAKGLTKEAAGLHLHAIPLDVTKDESVAEARRFVDKHLGEKKLWALVNNAGILSSYGPAEWCSPAEYELAFQVNTLGVVRCTGAFLDLLKKSQGRLVSVSSIAGVISLPGNGPYCVSKYGVESFMDTMRRELKPFGVTCSLLEPGINKATNLMGMKAMEQRVDLVWQRMSEEKRAEYGEDYKQEFLKRWSDAIDRVGTSRIEYVVDNYFHTITAAYPRHRYHCGWDAILLWIPAAVLPTTLQDLFFTLLVGRRANRQTQAHSKSS